MDYSLKCHSYNFSISFKYSVGVKVRIGVKVKVGIMYRTFYIHNPNPNPKFENSGGKYKNAINIVYEYTHQDIPNIFLFLTFPLVDVYATFFPK